MTTAYVYATGLDTVEITATTADCFEMAQAASHQISYTKGTASAGTLAVTVKPAGADRFEELTVGGVAVTISMAADSTFGPFDGLFEAIKLTPTGGNGTFKAVIAGA